MTIEEKAKAYDEALEKAKKKYNSKYHPSEGQSGAYLNNTDLEEIFPRLKESEDEKMRTRLIALVEAFSQGKYKDEILAYLEKQKEQKPVEYIDFDNEFENQVSHLLASVLNGEHEYTEGFVKYVSQSLLEYAKIELKSKEWSEEYREEDLRTRFAFYTYKNEEEDGILYLSNVFVEETSRNKGFGTKILAAAEKVAETIGAITIRLKVKQNSPANTWYRKHGYGYLTFEDGYDWLEKNLEYLKPKQEWSKDDETAFSDLMWCIEQARKSAKDENDMGNIWFAENWLRNRLKYLRPQPRKEIYQAAKHDLAIRFMNYLDENRPNGKMSLSNGECEDIDKAFIENDWAKILRYVEKYSLSWKPSEEQMEALRIAHEIGTANESWAMLVLKTLYDDLQKLL